MHQDRISQLPDDVLISIICMLTLREATATSILSTRWRYLHAYVTSLDFPPFNFERERFSNYMNTVDRVLDSHRGGKVNVLKVETKKASFGKCLKFALTKKAEIIDIRNRGTSHNCFLRFNSNLIINRLLPAGLKCLKELSLSNVHVKDQDIELLVSNSIALESLSIELYYNSKYLKNVKIVGHPKLKHLDISHAWNFESIEIRDVLNLVSLRLYQLPRRCALQLSNIPNFVKLGYREIFGDLPHELFARMPSCIRDQLQLFHLSTSLFPVNLEPSFEFLNIKHLELVFNMSENPFVDLVHPLIEACHSLEKLQIKWVWKISDALSELEKGEASNIYRGLASNLNIYYLLPKRLSPNLKEVEIIGYVGCRSELKLASYIINNAAALQELVVVVCDLSEREKRIALARRDFRRITPSSINILIL